MKITIDIPQVHAPELLAVIASMLNKPEPAQDPTPDHPELELDDEAIELAETRWAVVEDDPTQRELPWNPSWPDPPQLPAGKTRWVSRGTFEDKYFHASGRHVFCLGLRGWGRTMSFSSDLPHIEAV